MIMTSTALKFMPYDNNRGGSKVFSEGKIDGFNTVTVVQASELDPSRWNIKLSFLPCWFYVLVKLLGGLPQKWML